MNTNVLDGLNDQLNSELYSANLYLSTAAYFEDKGLKGFAHWYYIQYLEENDHAIKIYKYINDRGGRVKINGIDAVKQDWDSVLDAVSFTLKHEKVVSKKINDLIGLSRDEKDYACEVFLAWFIEEQVEEEATVIDLVNKVQMISESKESLYMLDKELAARVFNPAGSANI